MCGVMYRTSVTCACAQYTRLRSRCKAALHLYYKNIEECILNTKSSRKFYSFVDKKLNSPYIIFRLMT